MARVCLYQMAVRPAMHEVGSSERLFTFVEGACCGRQEESWGRASRPKRFDSWLKNSLLPRLLKKVQMQGGVTHPKGWVPGEVRGVLGPYAAAPHLSSMGTRRGGTHRRWANVDGPFSGPSDFSVGHPHMLR